MKKMCQGWSRFGSCVAAGMLALVAAHAETGVTNIVNGVTSNAAGDYYVGNTGPLNGLVVTNAGVLNVASNGFVGFSAGASNNTALVTGTGSVWTNGGTLNIGYGTNANNNQLTIQNGATVINAKGDIGYDGANNSVLVTGTNSLWQSSGILVVGDHTTGNQLTITNGAGVNNSGHTYLGYAAAAANNSVLVTGPGSTWQFPTINTYVYLGYAGSSNTLTIAAGGTVTQGLSCAVILGHLAGANSNRALVTDTGSQWYPDSIFVGNDGNGNSLTITNGGQVNCHRSCFIGGNNGSSNTVLVTGPGSAWNPTYSFYIGNYGSGNNLTIASGGHVQDTGDGGVNNLQLGYGAGSRNNSITVTGPGSQLSMQRATSSQNTFYIGNRGSGNSVTVSNGGQIILVGGASDAVYVGASATASNTALTVTGSNSLLSLGGPLTIGDYGSGSQMSLANGGGVSNGAAFIGNIGAGNTVTVTDPGTVWNSSGDLTLGNAASANNNQLTITNGAQVFSASGYVGFNASNNNVFVTGGSVWSNSGPIRVGNAATANNNQLLIAGGSHVFSDSGGDASYIGYNAGGSINNSVLVTDPGSVWSESSGISVISGNRLTITNGGAVVADQFVSGSSQVLVTGAGSVLNMASLVRLGNANSELTIADGAQAISGNGQLAGTSNTVFVTGSGSVWSNASNLQIGYNGNSAQLIVSNGAAVYAANSYLASGGLGPFNNNSALVTGSGSIWSNSANLYVGYAGSSNTVTIANDGAVFATNATIGSGGNSGNSIILNGGKLAVSNTGGTGTLDLRYGTLTLKGGAVTANQFLATNGANSALSVEFDGVGPDPVLTVNGTAQLAGKLIVTNPPGYTPALSNTFTVLTAGTVSGQFAATNLTSLGGGLRWRVLSSSTSVVAQAISDTATPSVTTVPVSNVTHSAAQCGGTVTTVEGGSPITARGVCWNLGGTPTIADSHTTDGSGTGSFTSQITGLTPSQTYHVRAYATSAAGTGYGADRTCTTLVAPPGNTLSFNGANQYVNIPDANSLDMTNNYTLECWFKADSFGVAGNLRGLIDKYQTASANGYLLRLNGTNLDFDGIVTSNLNLQVGNWYHVAGVNSNGVRTLYLNGVARTLYGTPITVQANTNELRLGCDYRTRFFAGQMDEVRLWNTARSQNDIRDAMHTQLTGSETGLVAYYQFNANSGTALADLTANANTGTLSNSPAWAASTFPSADIIASRANLRGAWLAQTNSLDSSILNVSNTVMVGADFRVFGHDGGTLTSNTSDKPVALAWRLNRAWQVEGTGTFTGTLSFDCAGITNLIQNAARLRLLVDADGAFVDASAATGTYAANVFKASGQTLPQGGYYTIGEYGTQTLTAIAGPNGAISPSNAIVVTYGDSTNFVVTPNTYWHVGNVTTNGASVGAVTSFTWSNVVADGTINASFAADLAAQGTPHWWLAQYGLTNAGWTFDQAETNKTDSDAFDNGQEYIADTNPTNPASFFRITAISNSPTTTVSFVASAGRAYTLIGVTNLSSSAWLPVPGAGPRLGTGGADSLSDTNVPPKGPFYKLQVELP